MEPLKALTLLAATGIISLVGAGAAGFYAGYSAGHAKLDERANTPVAIATGPGGTVSLRPVLEDIRALSKQVEALSAAQSHVSAADEQKPLIDEIRALARQVDGLKALPVTRTREDGARVSTSQDYTPALQDIREEIRALNLKLEKGETRAPKQLVDEMRSLSASVQAQEPGVRRAITDEVRSAVAVLQNSEPKVPRALMDEIRLISANTRTQDGRPQASIVDQIKILAASIDSLKARLAHEGSGGDGAQIAQLQQLIAAASEEFGKCQTRLASFAGAGVAQEPTAARTNTIAVSQGAAHEPSTVVFYDNVMLKKDQEKQYDEIGVRLALQSIGARQVKVAVNRQGFGLAFGERKVFRSQDVECELNLMETNLNDSQARVSISCKR